MDNEREPHVRSWTPIATVCALLLIVPPATAAVDRSDCDAIHQFITAERGIDEAIDPVIETDTQLKARRRSAQQLLSCLDAAEGAIGPDDAVATLRQLAEQFLTFAGPAHESITPFTDARQLANHFTSGAAGQICDWAVTDPRIATDPAIVVLRDQMGLPPPRGYLFVRYFREGDVLPDLADGSPHTMRGFTLLTRYVGIRAARAEFLPTIVSHELVHAYINAVLGPDDLGVFPEWFHEGVAVYVSDSSRRVLAETDEGWQLMADTEEYDRYLTVFEYLEARLGRAGLLQAVRAAIQERSVAGLLARLKVGSYEDLVQLADAYRFPYRTFNATPWIAGVCGVVVLGWIATLVRAPRSAADPDEPFRQAAHAMPSRPRPIETVSTKGHAR